MIKPGEIQKKARSTGVRDQQIEKDYILSWILQGIASHNELSKAIVFKGGTVLKKVYFEDYRFSEDLDFTLMNYLVAELTRYQTKIDLISKQSFGELTPERLEQRLPQYKARWQKSMKEQILNLPEFEQVARENMRQLRKLKI